MLGSSARLPNLGMSGWWATLAITSCRDQTFRSLLSKFANELPTPTPRKEYGGLRSNERLGVLKSLAFSLLIHCDCRSACAVAYSHFARYGQRSHVTRRTAQRYFQEAASNYRRLSALAS